MKYLISPAAMRKCEEKYFAESGVKSIDIMENAAHALADAIRAALPEGSTVYFACGTGGNGGDGTACARLLHEKYQCTIIQPKEPKTPDAIENLRRAKECGIKIVMPERPDMLNHHHAWVDVMRNHPDAWVDALFGTGLSRSPQGIEARLIEVINLQQQCGAKVFSADIPSGLNGATGQPYEPCVHADRTITFQLRKTGMFLGEGLDLCGRVTVANVGFPADIFPFRSDARLIEPSDIQQLPSRPRNIHKGDCGHLLIVAGSFGMAGAAVMCAKAALRSGVGLLTIACVKSIVPILQMQVPQAMCIPLEEDDGAISIDALPKLQAALKGKDAAVIGPGLTRRVPPEIIRAVLESSIACVVDADALNILSEHRELLSLLSEKHVITPHPGEAVRLIPDLDASDPISAAKALNDLGPTALYKGASCVIAGRGGNFISQSGCCGMARGGSGDILCGILGALLAGKPAINLTLTAALASEIHGLAGELAQQKYGSRSMNAMDIIEFLPEVFPK